MAALQQRIAKQEKRGIVGGKFWGVNTCRGVTISEQPAASARVKPTHACPSHLTVDGRRGMADSTKRRGEILKEITELAKLQKEAVEDATFMGRSTIGDGAYEERARRISRLVSELVALDQSKIA
jgi:hypothetical protein